MTTTRPTSRTPGPDSGGHGDPQPQRRGFAAVVPLRRMFAPENRDVVVLTATTVFLVAFGLVMVLSASSVEEQASSGDPFGRVARQAVFAAVGIPLMLVVSRFPTRFWKRWSWPALMLGAVLQILVFVPGLSYDYGGNQNWLSIGGFTMQPSEFVKLALVVWVAWVFAAKRDLLGDWKHAFIPVVPVAGAAIALVLVGRDLGTATIMMLIVVSCAFFGGVRMRHLVVAMIGVAMAAVLFAMTSPSRVSRITAWMSGCTSEDYSGYCWQPQHGMWALASGGVFGVGLGNSKAKWSWLPEADSDYIFAIIGEELGLIGALLVIALFVTLAIVLVRIMRRTKDDFSRIVTGGVLAWIIGQAFVNIAVVLGLLPVLGVPLPLISSGGSALLAVLLAIGVVLSIARTTAAGETAAAEELVDRPFVSMPGRRR
jgi:cell division protein FtsW